MKSTKIYLPLIAAGLLMSACDDQVMEWRESDPTVKPTEIPLKLAETLSRYDYLKNYMAEYRPDAKIFLGMGLDDFLASPEYRQVVLDNYQGVTFGNAMKHGSLVKANGSIDWTKVDQFLAMNTGLDIYGHNLIWHTQQNQSYLKSLIEPAMELVGDPDADRVCENIIVNGDFEKGEISPCIGWNNHTASVSQPGYESDYCMKLEVSAASTDNWRDQRFW
ncbi:MAG: endo-1,4-beta-xylanase, partial [Duncaniella sp.]|nr:endo-1,4-beta-xylanase [Duncaniella sp.]